MRYTQTDLNAWSQTLDHARLYLIEERVTDNLANPWQNYEDAIVMLYWASYRVSTLVPNKRGRVRA